MPTDVTIIIGGVDRTSYVQSASVEKVGSIETLSLVTRDIANAGSGAWRPNVGTTYRISANSNTVLLAGGTLDEITEEVIMGKNGPAVTRLQLRGRGYEVIPSQIFVESYSLPAQSVLASYNQVCNDLLVPRGVTNVMSPTTGGPNVPALTFTDVFVSDIIDQLQVLSGVPHRLQGDKWFTANIPGTVTGAAMNSTNMLIRSATKDTARTLQITRGYGTVTLANDVVWTETVVGNGTKTVFPLTVRPTANALPTQVIDSGGTHTIGGGTWSYDANTSSLIRSTALTGNANTTYTVSGSTMVRRWDSTAQYANGAFTLTNVDAVIDLSQHTELTAASAYLASVVAQRSSPLTTLSVLTTQLDYFPWQSVSVTLPQMAANGTYFIQSTETNIDAISRIAETRVTMLAGDDIDPDLWTRQFRRGGAMSGGGSIVASGGSGGGTTGAVPLRLNLGGSNITAVSNTAGVWVDAPEAIPLYASTTLAGLGLYTLRTVRFVRGTATLDVGLWNQTTNTLVANVSSTSATSWASDSVSSIALTAGHTYMLKVRVSGTGDGVCGHSTLEIN